MKNNDIAVIGGGPAGLMAAECLSMKGYSVTVYEAKPTFGRKLLLAGKSGLNITHIEQHSTFRERFGNASGRLRTALDAFGSQDVRLWAAALGTETFIGSSGRVFPVVMKASPLLRAWLRQLETNGVRLSARHCWTGFKNGGYVFDTPQGETIIRPDAAVLALGGASWPNLGSDARWLPWLQQYGIDIHPFRPANCGFDVAWSDTFRNRFAGVPIKSVQAISAAGAFQGEFVVTENGIEGSLAYAHSSTLRDQLEHTGEAIFVIDLAPGRTFERLVKDLERQNAKLSHSNRLRKGAGIVGVKSALVRELVPDASSLPPAGLAGIIKALPIPLSRTRPIEEAISSAGGIAWSELDDHYMLKNLPGIFVAGEMLDWEAPTGGYLLTASFATGRAAARGVLNWLEAQ